MDLLSRLRAPGADRYELLPEPLAAMFRRQRMSRRAWGVALALVVFSLGLGLAWYELDPPLSYEEKEFIAVGVLMMGSAFVLGGWVFLVPDPALWVLAEEDIVWAYRRVRSGGEQSLVFASDRGLEATLRMDVPGEQLTEATVGEALAALSTLHPQVHAGFTPELQRAYARDPGALRRTGTARPRGLLPTLYVWRRGLAMALIFGGILLVVVVMPILRIMMMSRD